MSLSFTAAVPTLPQEQLSASRLTEKEDDTWLRPLWEYSFPPMAGDKQLAKEGTEQASQQPQISSPGPAPVSNVSPRTKATSGSASKKRRRSKGAAAREGERSNRRRGENKEKRIMERCRGAPSWLTGKINAIHPPPSSSFTNLSTSIIYPPQIPIPSSAHWAATRLFPAQQPYNHVNPYARRGSVPPSLTQSTQGLNGPAENVDYLGVKMSDDTTKRRASEPCNSMLDGTPLMFESNCNTNWSHLSMGLVGTQSMGRSRGTSQDGSAGDNWAGENQEVWANGMDRSNSLSTVAESQQLKNSYPAWLPMNMNPANSQDDTIHSFDPLTPSSVHTNLQPLTHIPSYPSPLVTSFNPALTYMIEPMNIDLYFSGFSSEHCFAAHGQPDLTHFSKPNEREPYPSYFHDMNAPSHLQTDRTRQHQGLSYDKVEVSNASGKSKFNLHRALRMIR
ncbi:hypothetical protein I307_05679 [Cryptococcus deuterogattii 99/473]|uniref:Uncharacterized protein n=1 Tax=Cryptococcus deuterogattii Ram5 TaxID=1296110 RepID=A0A0D0V0U4_9TREE|nr:hypothetical protein I309_06556 [Cryptococcus deuterogattii LA55]KIR38545.1 hypothetical protein I313_05657 [Cryptococcus deuterogattii Ram5]KIR90262.1 hypothetical protein I304_05838 [Cryptococcus deuterogattii CBS 10090]KIY55027.1 hypothetical protein I307_05679 [Cryptococcus deuterogattii 99/473]